MKKKETPHKSLEEALIDLYLNVKIRKQEDIEHFNTEALSEEKETLKKTNPLTIIDYIKNSIDVLIDLKVEEKLEVIRKINISNEEEDVQNEYETLLRKLESDIRLHIKIEHQLKLHSDGLQQKIEDLEKENEKKKIDDLKIKDSTQDKKDTEIQNLKNSISSLKQILKSYEEQSLKMSDLEKNIRTQNAKHEKGIKSVEDKYIEKIKLLNKKINYYEETLKMNNFAIKTFKNDDEDLKLSSLNNEQIYENKNTGKSPFSSIDKKINLENSRNINNNERFKKIIDNKLSDLSNSKNKNSQIKKQNNILNDRLYTSNKSFIHEEKSSMNETSKSYIKNDSLAKTLGSNVKKLLNKDNFRTHTKTFSVEIKSEKSKSPNPTGKSINDIKDLLVNNNSSVNVLANLSKNNNINNSNYKSLKNNNNSQSNSNLFSKSSTNINNNNNNYGTNGNIKSEINLRNYIMTKMVKTKPYNSGKNSKVVSSVSGHIRSISNNILH